jgi:diphthine-ammonia ligase
MEMNKHTVCSWSGGKDSCFALMTAIAEGYRPKVILNVLNEGGQRSRSHGIPAAILQAQANAMKLPIHMIASSWQEYEQHFTAALKHLKDEFALSYAVFGDIDLQAHRDWEEMVCTKAGLAPHLPLWQKNRRELVMQMLDAGIEAIIVSCNERMGWNFLGKRITPLLIDQLESIGIDACGENGEYHTLVTNCPLFNEPIAVHITNKQQHQQYWFAELALAGMSPE